MDIQKLQLLVQKGKPKERYDAISAIVKSGHSDAIRILSEALQYEDNQKIRDRIERGIQFLKQHQNSSSSDNLTQPVEVSPSVINKVRQALHSNDPSQELKALNFIVTNCYTPMVTEAIELAHQRNSSEFTIRVIQSIGALKRSEFSNDLVDFIKSKDTNIVSATISALYQMGCLNDFLSFLKEFILGSDQNLRNVAQEHLKLLVNSNHSEAENLYVEIQAQLEKIAKVEAYKPYIPEGMEDLLPRNINDVEEEKEQNKAILKRKAALAFRYKSQLESEDPKLRIQGMLNLAETGDPEAEALLTQLLAIETDYTVIATGLSSLGRMKSETSLQTLQNFLSHQDNRVRANAAEAIDLSLGDKPKPMLEALLKDPCHRVRANSISALLASKPKECFLPLLTLVNSSQADENIAAILIIQKFQLDTHLIMLEKFMQSPHDKVIKRTKDVLSKWQGDSVLSEYLLNNGENFQDFYRNHLEQKKANQSLENTNSAETPGNKPSNDDEPEIKSDSETGFFANLIKKFRT